MMGFNGFGIIEHAGTIWFIVDWSLRILALFIVPRNRKPTAGMAWLMTIFFFPLGGFALYVVLGSPKLPKVRREAQKNLDEIIAKTLTNLKTYKNFQKQLNVAVPKKYEALARLNQSLTRLPVVGGNKIELLPKYNEAISRIVADIDKSQHFVHVEYFIIVRDAATEPLLAALVRAAKRGVQTRVLYDSLSTKRFKNWKAMVKQLEADGVVVQAVLPLKLPGKGYVRPDLRNHRKLTVIDGRVGYTGSLNLVQRDYHRKDDIYYDEMVVRTQGTVTLELSAIFLTDWYTETGVILNHTDLGVNLNDKLSYGHSLAQLVPSGPGYDDENNLKLFTSLIYTAEKRITIVNPYLVPDDALITAITSAARRGVDVTIINSEAIDQWMVAHAQRSFYEVLLEAGAKIYLYKAPTLLHSKFITVDDDIAAVGSSNLDIRSFFLNLELTLVAYDAEVVRDFRKTETHYLASSRQITLDEWRNRPRHAILIDNIARLTSSLQ